MRFSGAEASQRFRAAAAVVADVDSRPHFLPATSEDSKARRAQPWAWLWMGALMTILAIVAFPVGSKTFLLQEDKAQFYRHFFDPAINLACSGRLAAYELDEQSQAFLADKIETFQGCSAVRAAKPSNVWDPFDTQSVYMYAATAASWRLFGFQWESLHVLAGLLAAGYAAAAFLFLRCFTFSSALAFAGALLLFYAPTTQHFLPELRDFSKAPFILLPLALLGLAVTRPLSTRTILMLFGAAGLLVAFGRGFRPDVAVVVPIAFVAALLLLLPVQKRLSSPREAAAAFGVFLAAVLVGSIPLVLIGLTHHPVGSLSPHFFVLGFAERFFEIDLAMGSADYALGRFYNDVLAMHHADARVTGGGVIRDAYGSPSYDRAAWAYFWDAARMAPHDLFVRVFYALSEVPRQTLGLTGFGWPALGCLAAAAIGAPRMVLFFLAGFGALLTISTLQFHERHFFYLMIFWPSLLLCGVSGAVLAVAGARTLGRAPFSKTALAWTGASTIVVIALVVVLDQSLAAMQQRNLERIAARYERLQWRPLEVQASTAALIVKRPTEGDRAFLYKFSGRFPPDDASPVPQTAVEWAPPSDGVKKEDNARGFSLTLNKTGGYQILSLPLETAAIRRTDASKRVAINIDIEVVAPQIAVGLLAGDQSHWIDSAQVLKRGPHRRSLAFTVPASESSFIVVLESLAGGGRAVVRSIAVLPEGSSCFGDVFRVGQVYKTNGADMRESPEEVRTGSQVQYFFPVFYDQYVSFDRLELEGFGPACQPSVEWTDIPRNSAIPELELVRGVTPSFVRGSLGEALGRVFGPFRFRLADAAT